MRGDLLLPRCFDIAKLGILVGFGGTTGTIPEEDESVSYPWEEDGGSAGVHDKTQDDLSLAGEVRCSCPVKSKVGADVKSPIFGLVVPSTTGEESALLSLAVDMGRAQRMESSPSDDDESDGESTRSKGPSASSSRVPTTLSSTSCSADSPNGRANEEISDVITGEREDVSLSSVLPSVFGSEELRGDGFVVGGSATTRGGTGVQHLEVSSKYWSMSSILGRWFGWGVQQRSKILQIPSVNHFPSTPRGRPGRSPLLTFETTAHILWRENGTRPLRTSYITIPSA